MITSGDSLFKNHHFHAFAALHLHSNFIGRIESISTDFKIESYSHRLNILFKNGHSLVYEVPHECDVTKALPEDLIAQCAMLYDLPSIGKEPDDT